MRVKLELDTSDPADLERLERLFGGDRSRPFNMPGQVIPNSSTPYTDTNMESETDTDADSFELVDNDHSRCSPDTDNK